MKTKTFLSLIALLSTLNGVTQAAPLGTAFTYQGKLADGGSSANGAYDLKFSLYDAESGGTPVVGPLTNSAVAVSNGGFSVTLDFGPAAFDGDARWLEIGVRSNGVAADFTGLAPRQAITAAPYAVYAPNAGAAASATTASTAASVAAGAVGTAALQAGAVDASKIAAAAVGPNQLSPEVLSNTFWRLDGNFGTVPGTQFLGTRDNQPLELLVNNQRALRLEPNASGAPNLIGGAPNNLVNAGVVGAVIGGGGATNYYGSPFPNVVEADFGAIGGGYQNTVRGSSLASAIGGGVANDIGVSSYYSAIGGGRNNKVGAYSYYSTIAGGIMNDIGDNSTYGTIAGGSNNRIQTNAAYSAIGGGANNSIQIASGWATIGGGTDNTILTNCSRATIAGGVENAIGANASYATIGGGAVNAIQTNATHSVIAGGVWNTNTGPYAMIPGGRENSAAKYGFAAGRRAKAVHEGTFVWADSTNADFSSTTSNQFNVRASGGVRLETAGAGMTLDGAAVLTGTVQVGQIAPGAVNSVAIQDGSVAAADVNAATFGQTFWKADGNAGTTPGAYFLGTTDNQPLEIKVNNQRVLRLEPATGVPNVVAGYSGNSVSAWTVGAAIGGGGAPGQVNSVSGDHSTVGGGRGNQIGASMSATIAGGQSNNIGVNSAFTTIGGGSDNRIALNSAASTIAGGIYNNIGTNSQQNAIGGGYSNKIGNVSFWATIMGGLSNDIGTNSNGSVIGGGTYNSIAGNLYDATIAGGGNNSVSTNSSYSAIGGGYLNHVEANASYATIPGGRYNSVTADYAFAAGFRAKANHTGAFVWGDITGVDLVSTNANSVTLRAAGGYRLFSNSGATAGTYLAPGAGSWTSMSDRSVKENFRAVDPVAVLHKVASLPLQTWNYKSQAAQIRHLGPMAQDFKAAFDLGESDTGITSVDADGVALAAIQGLNQKLEQKETEITELKKRLGRLEQLLTAKNGGGR